MVLPLMGAIRKSLLRSHGHVARQRPALRSNQVLPRNADAVASFERSLRKLEDQIGAFVGSSATRGEGTTLSVSKMNGLAIYGTALGIGV